MISPNRSNRKQKTQGGRPLRRYRRRWKIERVFAWMQNYRRLVSRWEYHINIYEMRSSHRKSHANHFGASLLNISPILSHPNLSHNRDTKRRRRFHLPLHQLLHLVRVIRHHIEQQFIMHL